MSSQTPARTRQPENRAIENAAAQASASPVDPMTAMRNVITSEAMQQQFRMALPTHMKSEMFTRNLITAIQENPDLLKCTKTSLLKSAMTAAQLGLLVGSALGQAYIIPFRNGGSTEATFIPGYRGFITLARNSGEVESLSAFEVCANDEFDYQLGFDVSLRHKPAMGERGPIKFVYCAVTYKDGGRHLEVMTSAEVEAIRARSKAPNSPAWKNDWMMMARKTVIRRTAKYLPLSVQRLAALDAQHEFGDNAAVSLDHSPVIEGHAERAPSGGGRLAHFETAGGENSAYGGEGGGEDVAHDEDGVIIENDNSGASANEPTTAAAGAAATAEPRVQTSGDPLPDTGRGAEGTQADLLGGDGISDSVNHFIALMDGLNNAGAIESEVEKQQPWIDTLDGDDRISVDNAVSKARERARRRQK